jgi:tetratricopeptide (TPR) repeat protein
MRRRAVTTINALLRDAGALSSSGKFGLAKSLYRRALEMAPDNGRIHFRLGCLYGHLGDHAAAFSHLQQAARLLPHSVDPPMATGDLHASLDRWDEAAVSFEEILRIDPRNKQARLKLIESRRHQRRFEEAERAVRGALQMFPDDSDFLGGLGLILTDLGRAGDAIEPIQRALQIKPDDAELHMLLANVHRNSGRLEEAVACGQRAVELNPTSLARMNLGIDQLRIGRLREGWTNYRAVSDERFEEQQTVYNRYAAEVWDGAALNGRTLVVYAQEGLGDTILHARFVRLAAERAGRPVVLAVQPELVELLADTPGTSEVLPLSLDSAGLFRHFDYRISLLSLPLVLGTAEKTIPPPHLPVRVSAGAEAFWREKLAGVGGPKVGLRWAGHSNFVDDRLRSVCLDAFAPLAAIGDVTFVSLQVGPPAGEILSGSHGLNILHAPEGLADFTCTAALLRQLDLVISTCTSVPHLAGALGVETWLLVPFVPFWTWNVNHPADTPWYPRHRLFRQPDHGDWTSPIDRICSALAERVAVGAHFADFERIS